MDANNDSVGGLHVFLVSVLVFELDIEIFLCIQN